MPPSAEQEQRQSLLHLKSLFWCLHQLSEQYSVNLVLHSLERNALHPDLEFSHLGDNLQFLMEAFSPEDLAQLQGALEFQVKSRSEMDVGDRHFEIGHYVQAERSFGPIAEGSYGIICAITPQLRGLFYLEGDHLMGSSFAPSDVRVLFGTFIT